MAENHPRLEFRNLEFHYIKLRYRDLPWASVICNDVLGVPTIKPGMIGNRFNERLRPISQRSFVLHPHNIKYGRISIILFGRHRNCLELPKSSDYTDYDNEKIFYLAFTFHLNAT